MNPNAPAPFPSALSRFANPLRILALAVILLVFYAGLVSWSGLRANFAESNFQTNMLRVETYLFGPPSQNVLVGSSVSGRLLPEYFKKSGVAVANLGLDGATAQTGLQTVCDSATLPRVVLIEIQAITRPPTANDPMLIEAMKGTTFILSRWVPIIRAEYRPSSILYSQMKRAKDRLQPLDPAPLIAAAREAGNPTTDGAEDGTAVDPLGRRLVQSLQAKGVRCILLQLPTNSDDPNRAQKAKAVAKSLNMEFLDVESIVAQSGYEVQYSDGLHMTASSAEAAAIVTGAWIASH